MPSHGPDAELRTSPFRERDHASHRATRQPSSAGVYGRSKPCTSRCPAQAAKQAAISSASASKAVELFPSNAVVIPANSGPLVGKSSREGLTEVFEPDLS